MNENLDSPTSTFAVLAAAIAAAGGRVHIRSIDILHHNAQSCIDWKTDGQGGLIGTLTKREPIIINPGDVILELTRPPIKARKESER